MCCIKVFWFSILENYFEIVQNTSENILKILVQNTFSKYFENAK